MRRLFLPVLTALALAGGVAAFSPVTREVIVLPPSGDAEDRVTIRDGHTGDLTLSGALPHRLSTIRLILRAPVPPGELVVTLGQGDHRREAVVSLASATADGTLIIPLEFLPTSPRDALHLTLSPRKLEGGPLAFATVGPTPRDVSQTLSLNSRPSDRRLALTLLAREPRALTAWEHANLPLPRPRDVGLAGIGALAGLLAFALVRTVNRPRRFALILGGAFLVSLVLHEPFRLTYPATNDEGSILMDIMNVRFGTWPFRDEGGAKGPLALALLAPVVLTAADPLAAARGLVSLFAALEAVLLGILARRLWGPRTGALAVLLAAATPAVLAQTAQVFLQPFALPFVTLALILLARRGPSVTPLSQDDRRFASGFRFRMWAPAAAGVLFGLAFLARPTTLAFVPAGLLLALADPARPWRARLQSAGSVLGGLLLTAAVASLLLLPALGHLKAADALGWQGTVVAQERVERGLAAGGLQELADLSPSRAGLDRAVKRALPLLYGALPLLSLTAVFLAVQGSALLRLPRTVPAAVAVLVAVLAFTLTTAQLTTGDQGQRLLLLAAHGLLLLTVALSLRVRPTPAASARDLLFLIGTFAALSIGYANFGRFRAHYHAEYLPLYALAAAAVLGSLGRSAGTVRWWAEAVGLAALGATIALATPVTLRRPHAGNIPLDVVRTVTGDLQQRTAPGEEIFTAQVLFPALAGRPVPFGIAHPGWYREEGLGILPTALRARYSPDRDTLRRHLVEKPVRVAVVEIRTRETFLAFDPALNDLLDTAYRRVRTIENPLVDAIEILERPE